MAQPITLSGAMPGQETNGLAPYAKTIMDNDTILYPVVAMLAVSKVTKKVKTGEVYPTMAVAHWELVQGDENVKAHAHLLGGALSERSGMLTLPFEAGEDSRTDPFPEEE